MTDTTAADSTVGVFDESPPSSQTSVASTTTSRTITSPASLRQPPTQSSHQIPIPTQSAAATIPVSVTIKTSPAVSRVPIPKSKPPTSATTSKPTAPVAPTAVSSPASSAYASVSAPASSSIVSKLSSPPTSSPSTSAPTGSKRHDWASSTAMISSIEKQPQVIESMTNTSAATTLSSSNHASESSLQSSPATSNSASVAPSSVPVSSINQPTTGSEMDVSHDQRPSMNEEVGDVESEEEEYMDDGTGDGALDVDDHHNSRGCFCADPRPTATDVLCSRSSHPKTNCYWTHLACVEGFSGEAFKRFTFGTSLFLCRECVNQPNYRHPSSEAWTCEFESKYGNIYNPADKSASTTRIPIKTASASSTPLKSTTALTLTVAARVVESALKETIRESLQHQQQLPTTSSSITNSDDFRQFTPAELVAFQRAAALKLLAGTTSPQTLAQVEAALQAASSSSDAATTTAAPMRKKPGPKPKNKTTSQPKPTPVAAAPTPTRHTPRFAGTSSPPLSPIPWLYFRPVTLPILPREVKVKLNGEIVHQREGVLVHDKELGRGRRKRKAPAAIADEEQTTSTSVTLKDESKEESAKSSASAAPSTANKKSKQRKSSHSIDTSFDNHQGGPRFTLSFDDDSEDADEEMADLEIDPDVTDEPLQVTVSIKRKKSSSQLHTRSSSSVDHTTQEMEVDDEQEDDSPSTIDPSTLSPPPIQPSTHGLFWCRCPCDPLCKSLHTGAPSKSVSISDNTIKSMIVKIRSSTNSSAPDTSSPIVVVDVLVASLVQVLTQANLTLAQLSQMNVNLLRTILHAAISKLSKDQQQSVDTNPWMTCVLRDPLDQSINSSRVWWSEW